jgi:hypothetical protein
MKESAPFLKMYSEYVQNFDNSINLINAYRDKNPRFANIINEIQVSFDYRIGFGDFGHAC